MMISEWLKILPALGYFPKEMEKVLSEFICHKMVNMLVLISPVKQRITQKSPLEEIMLVLSEPTVDTEISEMSIYLVEILSDLLQRVRYARRGQELQNPGQSETLPILDLSGATDTDLKFLLQLFTASGKQDENDQLPRREMLSRLFNFIPRMSRQQSTPAKQRSNCASCQQKFGVFSRTKTCYTCKSLCCSDCSPILRKVPSFGEIKPQLVCNACCKMLDQHESVCWIEAGLQHVQVGTLESLRRAHGCFVLAMCSYDDTTGPLLKLGSELLRVGWPEMALQVSAALLDSNHNPKVVVKAHLLAANAMKSLADEPDAEWNDKWVYTVSAKEACINAELKLMELDNVEIPNLAKTKADVIDQLYSLCEERDEQSVCSNLQCLERAWEERAWEQLLAIVTVERSDCEDLMKGDSTLQALERFVEGREKYLEKMLPEDRYPFLLMRGLLRLQQCRYSACFEDLKRAAWSGHHSIWLSKVAVALMLTFCSQDAAKFALPFQNLHAIRASLSFTSLLSLEEDNPLSPLLGNLADIEDLVPPHPSKPNWPELIVPGVDMRATRKYEEAVFRKFDEGTLSENGPAMAYLDLIPALCHPAQLAVCFLIAGLWFLQDLKKKVDSDKTKKHKQQHGPAEIYALKKSVLHCLALTHAFAQTHLHPGMQFYISRLSLKAALCTVNFAGCVATPEDSKLIVSLLDMLIHSCRFCPFWNPPLVTVSEAVLLNIISGRLHSQFMLGLQRVTKQSQSPIHMPELKYQLYENDLRYVCPLDDPTSAHAAAMEELLKEKGWCFENVSSLMTSPLSPRSDEGWLVQQPVLGIPMEFASIEGFVLKLGVDGPAAVQLLTRPAGGGRVGLLSQADVSEVLEMEPHGAFFSLDQPNEKHRFHPFQEFRYAPEKLQCTNFLHTMFETDYLLKSFSVGSEVSAKPPFKQRPCFEGLTAQLPPHLRHALRPVQERGKSHFKAHRFWIQALELAFDCDQNGHTIEFRFGKPLMAIRSHPLIPDLDGMLKDSNEDDDPDSPEAQFAADLTKHYDELCHHFPLFARLKELVKLQFLSIAVHSVLQSMQEKASGRGIEVSDAMLTKIRNDSYDHKKGQIEHMLSDLRTQVSTWPAEYDSSKVSEMTQEILAQIRQAFQRQQGYWPSSSEMSEVMPEIRTRVLTALRERDRTVLAQVVGILVESCQHRVARSSMEDHVRRWLRGDCNQGLVQLICSSLPLPSRGDIVEEIRKHHLEVYNKFSHEVMQIKGKLPPANTRACKWVPAALLQKQLSDDSFSLCYGGVLLVPELKEARLPRLLGSIRVVTMKPCGNRRVQGQSVSYPKFTAPSAPFSARGDLATESTTTTLFMRFSKPLQEVVQSAVNIAAEKLTPDLVADTFCTNGQPSRARPCQANKANVLKCHKAIAVMRSTVDAHQRSGACPGTTVRTLRKGRDEAAASAHLQAATTSKGKYKSRKSGNQGGRGGAKRRSHGGAGPGSGRPPGSGGSGSGGSGGEEEEDWKGKQGAWWKKVKARAKERYTYHERGRPIELYLVEMHGVRKWISFDTAGHGYGKNRSAFKVWLDGKRRIVFESSYNADMEIAVAKHESNEGKVMQKRQLDNHQIYSTKDNELFSE